MSETQFRVPWTGGRARDPEGLSGDLPAYLGDARPGAMVPPCGPRNSGNGRCLCSVRLRGDERHSSRLDGRD